eukprot:gene15626-biopygen13103
MPGSPPMSNEDQQNRTEQQQRQRRPGGFFERKQCPGAESSASPAGRPEPPAASWRRDCRLSALRSCDSLNAAVEPAQRDRLRGRPAPRALIRDCQAACVPHPYPMAAAPLRAAESSRDRVRFDVEYTRSICVVEC